MDYVLRVQLHEPEIFTGEPKYQDESWMLSGAINPEINRTFVFTEMVRDESLGRVFPDLKPMSNNEFEIELAAEFSTKWPLPEDENEWCVNINLDGEVKPLIVSNQMIKIYSHEGIPKEDATVWYLPGPAYRAFIEQRGISEEDISVVKCNTIVTMRFIITGNDAQEALDNNLSDNLVLFAKYINKYVNRVRIANIPNTSTVPHLIERLSIGTLFVLVKGVDETNITFIRLDVNLSQAHSWPLLKDDEVIMIQNLCQAERQLPVYWRIHVLSRGYLDHSIWREAFLNAVIACESCLYIFNLKKLEKQGISRTKLADHYDRDITYGSNYNILLPILIDNTILDEGKLAVINNARKIRNAIVHGEEVDIDRAKAAEIVTLSREFIEVLEINSAEEGIDIRDKT